MARSNISLHRWAPATALIFLAVYLAAWIRRSNVLTGAAWITTRFGEGRGGEKRRRSESCKYT